MLHKFCGTLKCYTAIHHAVLDESTAHLVDFYRRFWFVHMYDFLFHVNFVIQHKQHQQQSTATIFHSKQCYLCRITAQKHLSYIAHSFPVEPYPLYVCPNKHILDVVFMLVKFNLLLMSNVLYSTKLLAVVTKTD